MYVRTLSNIKLISEPFVLAPILFFFVFFLLSFKVEDNFFVCLQFPIINTFFFFSTARNDHVVMSAHQTPKIGAGNL